MVRCYLSLLLFLTSCAGGQRTQGGPPANCEARVGDTCYATNAEACAAIDCPTDRCLILDSYPAQVQCQPPPDSQTDTETGTETGRTQECHPGNCGPEPGMPNALCPDGKTKSGPTGRCMYDPIADDCGWEILTCP